MKAMGHVHFGMALAIGHTLLVLRVGVVRTVLEGRRRDGKSRGAQFARLSLVRMFHSSKLQYRKLLIKSKMFYI